MSAFTINSVVAGLFDFTSWRDAGALLACSKGMNIKGTNQTMHSKFVQSLKDRLALSQTTLASTEAVVVEQRQRADDFALAWNRCFQCEVECRNGDMSPKAWDIDHLLCRVCCEPDYTFVVADYY